MEIKFDGEFDGVDFLLNEIPLDFYISKETPEEKEKRISEIKDFIEKELTEMLMDKS